MPKLSLLVRCSLLVGLATASWAQAPVVSAVLNGASLQSGGLAPGATMTIFGTNLTSGAGGTCSPAGITTCNGTQVLINGSPAPLLYIYPTQASFVVPFGVGGSTATVAVSAAGGVSAATTLPVVPYFPAFFTTGGNTVAATLGSNGSLISSTNPAHAGDVVAAFVNGLGTTTPAVADGSAAPSNPLAIVNGAVSVTVGGVPAVVLVACLAPGFVGYYQVNVIVPSGLSAGDQAIVATVGGVSTQSGITLPIATTAGGVTITTGADLGTFPVGEVQLPLRASGGSGAYTWSLVSGALPTGLALRTDVPASWVGAAAGVIGVATAPGTYTFSLKAVSGSSQAAQVFTMKITALNIKEGNSKLPEAYKNATYSYTFTALNASGAAHWSATSVPAGLTLDGSGVLSGTPTGNTGWSTINVTVSDGVDSVTKPVSLNLNALNITPDLLPNATPNTPYSATLTASGGAGPYTFSLPSTLPIGLSLSADGVISGSVGTNAGVWGFYVTVKDANNVSYTKGFSIDTVTAPAAMARVGLVGNLDDCTIGFYCNQVFSVGSGGKAPFTWTASGLPAGMSIRLAGQTQSGSWAGGTYYIYLTPGWGEVWGTPAATGDFNVRVTVTDADGVTASLQYPLHVSALGIDLADYLGSGTVGTSYTKQLRVLGGTGPYSTALTYGTMPAGMSLDGGSMVFSGTPLDGQIGSTYLGLRYADSGPGPNTLQLQQRFGTSLPTGRIYVTTSYALGSIAPNAAYSKQLAACCVAAYSWSLLGGSLPQGVNLSNAGLLSGTPTAPGSYTFTVGVADASNSANNAGRTFTLTVTSLSITTSSLPYGNVTIPYSQSLAAAGGTGSLSWSLLNFNYLPPGLSLTPAGVITGTPTATGFYSFSAVVTDSSGASVSRSLSITVYSATGAPPVVITTALALVSSGNPIDFCLAATGGNGSFTWTVAAGSLPPNMALRNDASTVCPSGSSAVLSGFPEIAATYTFTLQAASAGQTAQQVFTLKVPALVVKERGSSLQDAFTGSAYSYTFAALNNTGAVTYGACGTDSQNLPPGLTLSPAGLLSGTPATAGAYAMKFSATDSNETACATVTLHVYDVQITSPGVLPNGSQNAAYSYALAASGGTGSYSYSLGSNQSLPGGLTVSSAGVLSGTLTATPGRYGFNIVVSDGHVSYTKAMTLFVVAWPAVLPAVSLDANPSVLNDCSVGQYCSRTFYVSNGVPAPLTWSVTGLPSGMSARQSTGVPSSIYAGNVEIWGVPLESGLFTVRLVATDATGAAGTLEAQLRVSKLGQDGGGLGSWTYNVANSSLFRISGGTGPYTAELVNGYLPHGVSMTGGASGITFSGTPLESGNYSIRFLVTDAVGNTFLFAQVVSVNGPTGTTVTIYSGGANFGPYTVNTNPSLQLSAAGASAYTWTFISGTLPPGTTLSAGGLLSGTLTNSGTFTFVVKVSDASNAANYTYRYITVIVTPLGSSGPSTLPWGNAGTPYSQTLAVTGGSATWTVVQGSYLPPGITLSGTGVLSGTPAATGRYDFTLQATDGAGNYYRRAYTVFFYAAAMGPSVGITTAANLGTTSIGPNEIALSATGGTGTYTWSLVSGALPPGYSVRPDMPSYFSSSASASLSGVGTTPGTYNFVLSVTSGTMSASQAFTLKVSALTVMEDSTLPDAEVGQPYSFTFHALNNAGPVHWSATNIPAGITLDPNTGVLSGTPTVTGAFTMVFTIDDGVDSFTWWFQPVLNVYALRFTTPILLPPPTQYLPYSTVVTAAGGTPPYKFTANSLPAGLTLDPDSGVLSGTTTQGAGRFTFSLTVSDSHNVSRSRNANIVVLGAPAVMHRIGPYQLNGCTIGTPCSQPFGATTGGTPPFTWSASGLPSGMALRFGAAGASPNVSAGDVEIYGVASAAGTYPVTLTATDAAGISTISTFPLVVSKLFVQGVDTLPNGTRGVAYSKTLRIIGGAGPYSVTQVSGLLPAGLSRAGMVVSGIPTENGTYSPDFFFTDGGGLTKRQREGFSIGGGTGSTISISTGASLGTATAGGSYSNTLAACCIPTPYTWSASGLPAFLTLNSTTGVLSSTSLVAGTYTFVVTAADSANLSNYGVKQFTLIVTPISMTSGATLPVANLGTFYTQTLAATGGTGITWTLAPDNFLPPGLSLTAAGVLSGTPASTGNYAFSLTATDTLGNFYTKTFVLQVYPAGATAPLALNVGPNLGPARIGVIDVQLTTSGGTPPYHYAYSPSATPIPGMRVLDGPPLPTSFPSSVTGGLDGVVVSPKTTYDSSLRVTDSLGAVFDRPIHYTIVNTAPKDQSPLPRATAGQFYSYTMQGFGGMGAISWSGASLPPGLSIDSGGIISGTPTTGGSYSATLTMTDLGNNNVAVNNTYTIIVNPFAITTGGVLPSGTMNSPYSQQLTSACAGSCTWSVSSGSLPTGLSLSSAGLLSGTPTAFYNSGFLVQVAGANGTAQKELSLRIHFNTLQPLFITNSTVIGPTVLGNQVNVALSAQGGTPGYTWSLQSGALPTGISLRSPGETIGANYLPGFTYLAGRAMEPGDYTFTLKVTDGVGASTVQTFTWQVSQIAFSYTSLPITGTTLRYNVAYQQQLLAIGGTGVYTSWAVVSGSLPTGLALNPATGLISGTATNTGAFTAGIKVTDTAGNTMTQSMSFSVAGSTGVVLNVNNPDSVTFQIGATGSSVWSPTGGTSPYSFAPVTPYPPGCSIEYGAAVVGSTTNYRLLCSALTAGDFPFTFQMSDSAGNTAIRAMTVHVVPFTLFSATGLPDATVGVPYNQTLYVWNDAGATASLAPGSMLPPGLSIGPDSLTGTPTQAGAYSFTIAVADTHGNTVSYTFTLNVSTIRITTPYIIPAHAFVNVPYNYTMTATGGGTKVWSATSLPAGLTMSSGGTISGTPTTTGAYRVPVTVTDGASSILLAFTLIVRWNNPTIPNLNIATAALADARVGVSVSYTLSPSGGVPPFTWTLASGSILPPGLKLYSGSSAADYSSNQTIGLTYLQGSPTAAGSYAFDLIATDSVGTQMRRTFTLQITSVAILAGTLRTGVTGTPYAQQLTGVGGTPPYTFTYSQSGISTDMLPPGFTASATGLISGTTNSTGSYGFKATLRDNAGRTYTATYTLNVTNPTGLNVTTVMATGIRLGRSTSTTMTTNGTSTYSWSVSGGIVPPGLTLAPSGSSTVFTGAPRTAGTYTYTLRATDTANPSNFADRTYTSVIQPMQLITPGNVGMPPARVGSAYSYTFHLAGGTPPYTYNTTPLSPLTPGLTLSPGGVLSGVPSAIGSYTFQFYVTDSTGATGLITSPTLTILPPGVNNPLQGGSGTAPDAALADIYSIPIDTWPVGGVPPFTWGVAGGTSLPPGMTLWQGSNGVSSYFGGMPTTPGTYNWTFTIADAVGQTTTTLESITVSEIAVASSRAIHGVTGVPYSLAFTASGGTPPYTFALISGSSLAPGLSLSAAGLLSGTPTSAGAFTVGVTATDSSIPAKSVYFTRGIVIDNALSQAQAIAIPLDTIQINYTRTAAAPAAISVPITVTTGTVPFTAMVSSIPGATLSAVSGTAPATLTLTLNTAAISSAGTYVGLLAVNSSVAANGSASVPVVLTVQDPPPCTYSLSPSTGTVPASGGAGSFGMSVGGLCAWTAAASDPSWITVNSGAGPGPGTISYTVAANTGLTQRTGTITAGGQTYSITQFGSSCSYAISPLEVSVTAAGGLAPVAVTTSNAACSWSAIGLSASPSSGTGNQTVTLTVPPNLSPSSQNVTALFTGTGFSQTFTAHQSGINCTVSLGSPAATIGSGGGTGMVNVTTPAGCSYSTANLPGWVTVTSGGSGNGPGPVALNFSVIPNSTTVGRSATLSVGGQSFTINQDATPCSVTIDASGAGSPFGTSPGTGSIAVLANGSNCSWTASSGATWATMSPLSGTGNGAISVSVTSNATSAVARSTSLTIAGQSVSITQGGVNCVYSLGSSTASVPSGGGSGAVTVSAPSACLWNSSTDASAPWLTIGSTGTAGTADVTFAATPNPNATSRTGTLTVAGKSFTVTQAAAPCSYILSGTATTVAAGGAAGSFTFSTSTSGCSTTAVSYSSWLTATTAGGDTASGAVSFVAGANPAGTIRIGTIQFGGQTFTVTQTGAACAYSLNAAGVLISKAAYSNNVQGSQSAVGCGSPPVGVDQLFVTLGPIAGPASNIYTLPYTVAPFNSTITTTRTAIIGFGGQTFKVKQTSW